MARAKHQGRLRNNEANAFARKVERQTQHQELLKQHRDFKRGITKGVIDVDDKPELRFSDPNETLERIRREEAAASPNRPEFESRTAQATATYLQGLRLQNSPEASADN